MVFRMLKSHFLTLIHYSVNKSMFVKKWVEAIKEHIKYSERNIESPGSDSQMLVPIESLQQQLNVS